MVTPEGKLAITSTPNQVRLWALESSLGRTRCQPMGFATWKLLKHFPLASPPCPKCYSPLQGGMLAGPGYHVAQYSSLFTDSCAPML